MLALLERCRDHPAFRPYRALVDALVAAGSTDVDALDALAARAAHGELRFVAATQPLSALDYERRIVERGEITTRPGVVHDLMNALVWLRFPALKARLSALHCAPGEAEPGAGRRGPRRDALTLIDESGAVVVAPLPRLDALAGRRWREFFAAGLGEREGAGAQVIVVGHALLEKIALGQLGATAKCLGVVAEAHAPGTDVGDDGATGGAGSAGKGGGVARAARAPGVDTYVHAAARVLDVVASPRQLPPLPVAGIPGWHAASGDPAFHDDPRWFRPAGVRPASPHAWRDGAWRPLSA